VLATLIRKRIAALAELSEADVRGFLPPAEPSQVSAVPAERRGRTPRLPVRRAPSLARELIGAILLNPSLVRSVALPRPADGTPEGNALTALVDACHSADAPMSTPALMQRFAASAHEPVLAEALATTEDHALTVEDAEARLREGAEQWWRYARRAGKTIDPAAAPPVGEEAERLRQLEWVRQTSAGPGSSGPAGGSG
jgi:DNA primase DnaG DnaB-binding